MSTKVLSRIEAVLMTAGFIAIVADICMITAMYSVPAVQHPLRAFYVPVIALETFLYVKQMQREEMRYQRSLTAERRKQDNEQWLHEYEEFRRKVHR